MSTLTASQAMKSLSGKDLLKVDFSKFESLFPAEVKMPSFSPDKVGRYKLQQFLREKFGNSYHTHRGAKAMMDHFESESRAMATMGNRNAG
jgi:hypothetical protein